MKQNIHNLFCSLTKGKVDFIDSNTIKWILGDMILLFHDNCGEQVVQILLKNKHKELTHLHINDEDLDRFIKEIDDPEKIICVNGILFGLHFAIIDKSKAKKQNCFRHYSI